MVLAAERPLRWKLMAAMAQQDCGQCGYNCTDYSKAIFEQAEPRLNLCQPGGKATARMLKQLVEEMGGGVIDPEDPVDHRLTVGPADDSGEGYIVAVSGHRHGVVEVLTPSRVAQPIPSDTAPRQRNRGWMRRRGDATCAVPSRSRAVRCPRMSRWSTTS